MNYEQFVQEMLKCTREKLPESEKIERQNVLKNNGIVSVGLAIRKAEENVAPIIYLDEYYERYLSGERIENLSERLVQRSKNAPAPPIWNYEAILDFYEIKDRIVYRLINFERNKKLLKEVPHLPMLDLAIVFYVLVPSGEYDYCSVLIKNVHMNIWKLPISILYESAKRNTPKLCPYVFRPLEEFLDNMDFEGSGECPLWVLTNIMGMNGAATILYPRMPKRVYDKMECSYYLLPSSVHEFLIVPESKNIYPEDLLGMVCEVNATQIEREELLSDSIYHFDGKNITKM